MRRRKRHKPSHDMPHLDEKWLVSYSDLMTLLFGLFVMLYSFAMKNKSVAEAVEKELKRVSEKGFNSSAATPEESDIKLEDQDLKRVIVQLRKEVVTLQDQLDQAQAEVSMRELTAGQLQKELVETQEASASLVKKAVKMAESRAPASTHAQVAGPSNIMVYIRWENRNHDIDLTVINPNRQELNFKNRKVSDGDKDEFVSESTHGPGIELFKTTEAKDGEYEFNISLYNSRGDRRSSEVLLYVMIDGKEQVIERITLKDEDDKRTFIKRLNLKKLGQ